MKTELTKVTKQMVFDSQDVYEAKEKVVLQMMSDGASRTNKKEYDDAVEALAHAEKMFKDTSALYEKTMQKASAKATKGDFEAKDGKAIAFAQYVRNAIKRLPQNEDIKQALAVDNSTGGEDLIPEVISKSLITENRTYNKLREVEEVITTPGTHVFPLIEMGDFDDTSVDDVETAKEIELKGSTIESYGKKYKFNFPISETVVEGEDFALYTKIKELATNVLTRKERDLALGTTPEAGTEYSNFYDKTTVNIKHVTGVDIVEAIENARLDLGEDYREYASLLWNEKDIKAAVKKLAEGTNFYNNKTYEEIFSVKKVVLTDKAVLPIVGDFTKAKLHYSGPINFEAAKDIKTGLYDFVITARINHKIILSSAFRIAEVVVTP